MEHLAPGGSLIVLAPAHPALFSPFDQAVGHYRRYTGTTVARIAPAEVRLERLAYLDSVGIAVSLVNRLLLRRAIPTARQVRIWDRALVPLSTVLDPLLRFRLGKSVLAVWQAD